MTRRRVLGVDFSGARQAGDHIWIAAGTRSGGRLSLEGCRPARELSGGGRDRKSALAALKALLESERRAAAGLDFPFGLPRSLVAEERWEDFVRAFPRRYPDAGSFREACRRAAAWRELKRRTDVEARVPFSAYNLRLYRQTYFGIADVLLPLLDSGVARAVPMQPPAPGKVLLAETCPASLLKRLGLYVPYKGRDRRFEHARSGIIEWLFTNNLLTIRKKEVYRSLIEDSGGDALDAVLAAIATANLPRLRQATTDPVEKVEGKVYF